MVTFREVWRSDMPYVVNWRNNQLSMLRTPYMLTQEMQEEFYNQKIANRNSSCKFFGVEDSNYKLVGMAGLENIQWENRLAEISLITDPKRASLISEILYKLYDIAFLRMNLVSIFTEVYDCSPYKNMWAELAEVYGAYVSKVPYRKYWDGQYFHSTIYTFIGQEVKNGDSFIKPASSLN